MQESWVEVRVLRQLAQSLVWLMSAAPAALPADGSSGLGLEGTYISSLSSGGCALTLEPRARFHFSCQGGRASSGEILSITKGRGAAAPTIELLGLPVTLETADLPGFLETHIHVLQPPPRPSVPAWPPSLEDPTAPLVASFSEPLAAFRPVYWGKRLYLVRLGTMTAFCDYVGRGAEPLAIGGERLFLRAGDVHKQAGRKPPRECKEPHALS